MLSSSLPRLRRMGYRLAASVDEYELSKRPELAYQQSLLHQVLDVKK